MSSFEFIRIEIMRAQDALVDARDALLRVRHARETAEIINSLRRAIDCIDHAIGGCERVRGGDV
jgi:hypothetical protein